MPGSSPCGTPLTTGGWPRGGDPRAGRGGQSAHHSLLGLLVEHPAPGSTNLQQTIDPSMRLPLRICIFAFLTLSVTLTLMRLRNLILQLERRRPWVVALVNKGAAR